MLQAACWSWRSEVAGDTITGGKPHSAPGMPRKPFCPVLICRCSHALGLEADLNVILQSTLDRAEGIASFLERREPEFKGE